MFQINLWIQGLPLRIRLIFSCTLITLFNNLIYNNKYASNENNWLNSVIVLFVAKIFLLTTK